MTLFLVIIIILSILFVVLYRIHSNGIIILLYHNIGCPDAGMDRRLFVSPALFERQMRFLVKGKYHFASIDELMAYLNNKLSLPRKSVMITFDDGYEDNFEKALPILRKYGLPATIFLTTNFIGKKMLWNKAETNFVSQEQIKKLIDNGWSIGSHGVTHKELTRIPGFDAETEVVVSKSIIEKSLGVHASFFAYPYGSYNKNVRESVIKSGYSAACTLHKGINRKNVDPFALKRLLVKNTYPAFLFQWYTTPVIEMVKTYLRY